MFGKALVGEAYPAQAEPPRILWGVDSASDSRFLSSSITLYDRLIQPTQAGRKPTFWGRYIGGSFALTAVEVQFLHDRGVRVLLIYNGTTQALVEAQGEPGRQNGINAANAAIAAATALGAPGAKRVWIYCNTEFDWRVTSDFLEGWYTTLFPSPYGGGVYGSTARPEFAAYCDAYNNLPSEIRDRRMALLFTNNTSFCSGAGCDAELPGHAGIPGRTARAQYPPSFDRRVIPPCFAPVVLYQYALDLTIDGQTLAVDYDLASRFAFERMWAPSRPPGAWTAVKIAGSTTIATMSVARGVDVTSDGRIYLVWNDDSAAVWHNAYSDDGGDSWTVPTATSWLGEALSSIVTKGTAMHLFTRGHSTNPTRAIQRYKWDGGSWTGASTIYGPVPSPYTVGFPRAARARDHSGQSCAWRGGDTSNTVNDLRWAPVTNSGAMPSEVAVAQADLDTGGNPPVSYALYYNESGEPVLLWNTGGSSPYGRKRTRSGGSWGSISSFDAADLTLLESLILVDAGTLAEYSAGLQSSGDIHSVREHAGGNTLDLDYRRRISGSWTEDTLDLSGLISGSADSTDLLYKSVPIMLGSRMMVAVYTFGSTSFAVWFVYSDL